MINTSKFGTKSFLATVCVVATGLAAQAQEASTDTSAASQNQAPTSVVAPDQQSSGISKCSKIIGAQVRDSRGDILGKISDVVVDNNTGRVSYCALKVEASDLGGTKYLAVPLAALRPSVDRNYFILNADREKIAQARGFTKGNWPAVSDTAWGAQAPDTAPQATVAQDDQGQFLPPVTVTGAPDLNVATLPVPKADANLGNQAVVASPGDQYVTSPTGPFPTFTHVYLPGAVPR